MGKLKYVMDHLALGFLLYGATYFYNEMFTYLMCFLTGIFGFLCY